jgi:hypothetical protein
VEKARDPQGPILQELERLAVQTEPLLMDAEGVVVNGNRRLAAMRWLLAVDAQRYSRFEQPMAAVLPPEVERADLEFIEAALQMAPETKLAYSWLDRRLKLREQREQLGLADAWIVEAFRMDEPEQWSGNWRNWPWPRPTWLRSAAPPRATPPSAMPRLCAAVWRAS